MQQKEKKHSKKLGKKLSEEIREMVVVSKGRKYSKVTTSDSNNSIENPYVMNKSARKVKTKKIQTTQQNYFNPSLSCKKMQLKTNEAIERIENADSGEEASEQFKGLIKMCRHK